jgi:adenylosuccinate synthase
VDRTVEKELLREVEREVIKVVEVEQDDPFERVVERKLERPVETVVQKIMVRPAKPQEKTVEVPEQRELIREAIKPLDQKLKERLAGELKKKNLFEGELQANRLLISQLTD